MSFFNDFPHVRQYDGDLGWLIRTVQDLASTLENFVNLNTIKYADPIAWNIATQYEANTVVINSADGTAYLSTKPVPSGVSVTDTEYWTPIFNYGTSLDQIRAQIAALNEGSSSTASQAVTAGQLLWLDGELYQAAYDIAAGTAYISGVNVNPVTVETILDAFRTYVESAVASITKPILNVKEYGATGGGTIDDTEAIQSAIDDAEANGYAVHIPSGTYLVSTLWIRSDIHIFGTGKLKAYPLRYDTLAANTSAGSNTITVSDGSIYRKNMILTIKKSTSTEVMVVTGISGNELTIKKFRYYDGLSGTDYLDNAYPTGSEIHINTVPLVITRHLYTEAVDSDDSAYIINNCRIEGISVTGNRSGYDHSKYSIYDITLNGCIFAYRTRGLAISGGSYGSCYNNAIAIIGRTAATKVERTIIENVQVPSDISDISLKDVGGGILLHWDQRKQQSTEVSSNFTLNDNVINGCYCGIFTSAAKTGAIHGNKITNCDHHGIEIYSGDLGYGTYDIAVSENVISGNINNDGDYGHGIDLFSANRISVVNNTVVSCQRGLSARIAALCSISGNKIISCTDADIYIGRMDGKISENMLTSGAGCRATVEINNATASSISALVFSGNYYTGYNTLNAAINLIAAQNVSAINEFCNIRTLYKVASGLTAGDAISAYYCVMAVSNGHIAMTTAERAKIFMIDVYAAGIGWKMSSGKIQAKTTSERDAWVDPTLGSVIYNTTTGTLQVYGSGGWANV